MSRPALWACLLACLVPSGVQAQHDHHAHGEHDEHAGQETATDVDPHAGHRMPETTPGEHLAPREPIPPVTDADRAAAFPDVDGHAVHDDARHAFVLFDRLEAWDREAGGTAFGWAVQAWSGTDLDRTWLRTEGTAADDGVAHADIELFRGRMVATWWDALLGIRHRVGDGPSRTDLAIGVMGVAPMHVEVAATGYVGVDGRVSAILEAEYDMRLTNRLIAQWHGEAELHARDDVARGMGAGLATTAAGLRLRYEFTRKLAPYVGIVHERAHGATGDLRRAAGGEIGDTRLVAGFRTWF